MNQKQQTIYDLIQAIIFYLQQHSAESEGAASVLQKLDRMELTESSIVDVAPQASRHDETLNEAIGHISSPALTGIASKLKAAKEHLVWREDDGKYYQDGADLGEGYRRCNLHSLLIGPGGCGFEQRDFSLGFFMLGPRTL